MSRINLTRHGLKRLKQRFPEINNLSTLKEIKQYLLILINQYSIIAYYEPTNNTNVYIGSSFKIVVSADCYHDLVTFIS
jgi:hypothetical protein